LVLAATAGFVDVVGFLTLAGLSLSHLTGDTEHLGLGLAQSRWGDALHRFLPVAMFAVGVALGSLVLELALRRKVRRRLAVATGFEAVLLLALLVYGTVTLPPGTRAVPTTGELAVLVALGASAMGVQTTAIQGIAGRMVRTTFLSGIVVRLVENAVQYGFDLHDTLRQRPEEPRAAVLHSSLRRVPLQRVILLAGIWVAWLGGVAVGAWLQPAWGFPSLAIPLGVLAAVMVADLRRPFEFPSPLPEEEAGTEANVLT
jgi:uncharacterized membrane protein YoaK (UPF0700 family)